MHEFTIHYRPNYQPRGLGGGVSIPRHLELVVGETPLEAVGGQANGHAGGDPCPEGRGNDVADAVEATGELHSGDKVTNMNICKWLIRRLNRILYPHLGLNDRSMSEVYDETHKERGKAVQQVITSARKLAEMSQLTDQELASIGNRVRRAAIND